MNRIVKRSDKLTFFGVVDETGNITFHRMKGFSEISVKKNSREYSRQYVDEEFEQSDVVGYSPSITYTFDQFKDDPVHKDLVSLSALERVGNEAVRTILQVDLSDKDGEGKCQQLSGNSLLFSILRGIRWKAIVTVAHFALKAKRFLV